MKSINQQIRESKAPLFLSLLLVSFLLSPGCSGVREIPVDDVDSGGVGKADVVTRDGYVYNFEAIHVRGDSLYGSYSLVEERLYKDGGIAYEDVMYETALQLSNVSHIEVKKFDLGNTLLVGAGAALISVWLSDTAADEDGDSDTGKYIEDPP